MILHGITSRQHQAAVNERETVFTREIDLDFYTLFWIYTIASFVGLLVETAVSYPVDGMWKNRAGLVWGPFSPIYGVGAVLMTVMFNRFRDRGWFVLFLGTGLLGGAFEYLAGTFWEKAFGFVAWSYSDQFLNIQGHTCLAIAIVWGVLGVLWLKVLLPLTVKLAMRIPSRFRFGVTAIFLAFTVLDVATTIGAFSCWFDRQDGVPVTTPIQQFFDWRFGNAFMESHFQTISMYTQLAVR